jgi:hypothetical protein
VCVCVCARMCVGLCACVYPEQALAEENVRLRAGTSGMVSKADLQAAQVTGAVAD